jgi:hypothetical protein
MKSSRYLNVALLAMLFASPAAVFAQQPDEKPQEPKQEESKPAESKPATSKPDKQMQQDQQKAQQKEDKQEQKQEQKQQKEQEKQGNSNQMAPAQQQSHMAPPSGKSVHIPDNTFHQNFGRQHTFVVNQPVIVSGRPQVVYGGYTFVFLDPWPGEWAYTDDCYIDYIDGEYFLFDLLHPGIRIALFVSM